MRSRGQPAVRSSIPFAICLCLCPFLSTLQIYCIYNITPKWEANATTLWTRALPRRLLALLAAAQRGSRSGFVSSPWMLAKGSELVTTDVNSEISNTRVQWLGAIACRFECDWQIGADRNGQVHCTFKQSSVIEKRW